MDIGLEGPAQHPGDPVYGPIGEAEVIEVEDPLQVGGEDEAVAVGSPAWVPVGAGRRHQVGPAVSIGRDDGDVPTAVFFEY